MNHCHILPADMPVVVPPTAIPAAPAVIFLIKFLLFVMIIVLLF